MEQESTCRPVISHKVHGVRRFPGVSWTNMERSNTESKIQKEYLKIQAACSILPHCGRIMQPHAEIKNFNHGNLKLLKQEEHET